MPTAQTAAERTSLRSRDRQPVMYGRYTVNPVAQQQQTTVPHLTTHAPQLAAATRGQLAETWLEPHQRCGGSRGCVLPVPSAERPKQQQQQQHTLCSSCLCAVGLVEDDTLELGLEPVCVQQKQKQEHRQEETSECCFSYDVNNTSNVGGSCQHTANRHTANKANTTTTATNKLQTNALTTSWRPPL